MYTHIYLYICIHTCTRIFSCHVFSTVRAFDPTLVGDSVQEAACSPISADLDQQLVFTYSHPYVPTYTSVYIHMYIYIFICSNWSASVYPHVHLYTSYIIYMYMCVFPISAALDQQLVHVSTYLYIQMYICIYPFIFVFYTMYICMYPHIYIYAHPHICVCVSTHFSRSGPATVTYISASV